MKNTKSFVKVATALFGLGAICMLNSKEAKRTKNKIQKELAWKAYTRKAHKDTSRMNVEQLTKHFSELDDLERKVFCVKED